MVVSDLTDGVTSLPHHGICIDGTLVIFGGIEHGALEEPVRTGVRLAAALRVQLQVAAGIVCIAGNQP